MNIQSILQDGSPVANRLIELYRENPHLVGAKSAEMLKVLPDDLGLLAQAVKDMEPLAQKGDRRAQFVLGMCHRAERTSMKWLKLSGQSGLPEAQLALAFYYQDVQHADEAEGQRWLQMAVKQRYPPAIAAAVSSKRLDTLKAKAQRTRAEYSAALREAERQEAIRTSAAQLPADDPRLSDDALEKLFADNDKTQASGAKGSKKKRSKRSQQRRREQQRRRQEKKAQEEAEASAKAEAWEALQKGAAAAAEARAKEAAHVAEVQAKAAAALRRDRRREQRQRQAQRRLEAAAAEAKEKADAEQRAERRREKRRAKRAQRRELNRQAPQEAEPTPEPELAIALAVPVVVVAPAAATTAAPTPPPSMPPPGFDRDLEAAIKNSLLTADKEATYPGHAAMAFRAEQTAAAAEPSSPTTFNPVPGAAARKNSRRRERRRQKKQLQRGLSRLADADGHECRICLDACTDAVVACRSGHVFCRGCIQAWMAQGGAAGQTCPTCRVGIRAASLVSCCCPCEEVAPVAQPPQPIGANRSSPTTGNAMCRQGLLSYASARLC